MPEWESSKIAGYRIWAMWDGFMWWQRHEWKNKDGSIDMQEWIRSIQTQPGANYKKVAE